MKKQELMHAHGSLSKYDPSKWRVFGRKLLNESTAQRYPKGDAMSFHNKLKGIVIRVSRPIVLNLLFVCVNTITADVLINELCALNTSTFNSDYSSTPDWVELYNPSDSPVDISGYHLSDESTLLTKYTFPSNSTIPARGFLKIWVTDAATGFELSSKGEKLFLSSTEGASIDSLTFPAQLENISFGRLKDTLNAFRYFVTSTPGEPNTIRGYRMVEAAITFSHDMGFYSGPVTLTIASASGKVRYTTDGTQPMESSPIVPDNGLTVDHTCVINARVIDEGVISGVIETNSYFINEVTHNLPVFSITANPLRLFNEQIGPSGYAIGLYNNTNGNGNTVTGDIRATVQMFDNKGTCVINQDAEIKSFGMGANQFAQKSLAFNAKSSYGKSDFAYPMFPNKPILATKRFVLRNSGNDNCKTLFRDALVHLLMKDYADVDYLDYDPALLFVNGRYFGIHNIREKADEHYPSGNYGLTASEVDLLRGYGGAKLNEVMAGDDAHYTSIDEFITNHDIALPENYSHVKENIDIECFMDYLITQLYCANLDFMTNVKEWRPRTDNGRWRWILFDMDYSFGFPAEKGFYEHNSFENFSQRFCPVWRKKFLENPEYRAMLLHRYATHISTTFKPARVIAKIDAIAEKLKPAMPDHIDRWKDAVVPPGYTPLGTMDMWEKNIDSLKLFAVNRPEHFYEHMKKYYSLSTTVNVEIINRNPLGGTIYVAGIKLHDDTLSGKYFRDVPLTIKAVPRQGYKFEKWSNGDEHPETRLTLDSDTALSADFIQGEGITIHPLKPAGFDPVFHQSRNAIRIQGVPAYTVKMQVSLSDLKGRVVLNKHIHATNGEMVIDVSTVTAGIYLLSVFNGKSVVNYKILVEC